MKGMVDYALHYHRIGFSVIPIDKKSKRPITKFKDKTFTENDIKQIWRDNPDANIALRTDTFFVIDIDMHDGVDGISNFKSWEGAKYLPKTTYAKTPSGGRHIFLKKPKGIEINQNVGFIPGVDIKANINNYVLVAPSSNYKGCYEWDIENSLPNGDFAEAPQELINLLKAPKTDYKPHNYHSNGFGFSNKTTQLFETIVYGLGDKGGRNNKLASFVGGLLKRGVDIEVVYELAKITNANSRQPLSDKEVDRTVESMYRKDRSGT